MQPGDVLFDRYRVLRRIAEGGMGTVFEARDLVLDQPVALKRVRYAAFRPWRAGWPPRTREGSPTGTSSRATS